MSQKITNGANNIRKNLPYHSKGDFFCILLKSTTFWVLGTPKTTILGENLLKTTRGSMSGFFGQRTWPSYDCTERNGFTKFEENQSTFVFSSRTNTHKYIVFWKTTENLFLGPCSARSMFSSLDFWTLPGSSSN